MHHGSRQPNAGSRTQRRRRPPQRELEIDKLFRALVKLEGSDLHLKVGCPPFVRVHGTLRPLNRGPIDAEEMGRLIFPMIDRDARRQRIFAEDGGVDFAHTLDVDDKRWRFRVNVLQQMGNSGLVARRVNNRIPDFQSLYLPPVTGGTLPASAREWSCLAGVTGSGKTTTIASMLDWINHNYRKHILTLEDPIEFTFTEDKCLINQREIGMDVKDFMIGMKHAVREDPDVMLVGEMRDRETFETAIHAAETGHLVFGTIHASTAAEHDRPHPRPLPPGNARRAPQRPGVQHEGDHRPKAAALDQAGRGARADLRDHDLHAPWSASWCSKARTRSSPTPSASARRRGCRISR